MACGTACSAAASGFGRFLCIRRAKRWAQRLSSSTFRRRPSSSCMSTDLVHDDLPAMDDDDLRRGRPTCHRAFDEAIAILVGDALQALAFDVLAHDVQPNVSAAGASGDDPHPCVCERHERHGGRSGHRPRLGRPDTHRREGVENMHRRKTGALIQCSVLLGAACRRPAIGGPKLDALKRFGADIGLAFQIQDDILDIEGETAVIGKSAGADIARNKPTLPEHRRAAGGARTARGNCAREPLRRWRRSGQRPARWLSSRGSSSIARSNLLPKPSIAGRLRGESCVLL